MLRFRQLDSNQQKLFSDLWNTIIKKDSVANILKVYRSKHQDSANQDIKQVLTAFFCIKDGKKHTLLSWAIHHKNVEAFKSLLNEAEVNLACEDIFNSPLYCNEYLYACNLLEYASTRKEKEIVKIIEERTKKHGLFPLRKELDQKGRKWETTACVIGPMLITGGPILFILGMTGDWGMHAVAVGASLFMIGTFACIFCSGIIQEEGRRVVPDKETNIEISDSGVISYMREGISYIR